MTNLLDRAQDYQKMVKLREEIQIIKALPKVTGDHALRIAKLERDWKALRDKYLKAVSDTDDA